MGRGIAVYRSHGGARCQCSHDQRAKCHDECRKGYKLTDATFVLPRVELSRREVFSFSIARRLLERFEGTPLEMYMRSVLGKIAGNLEGTVCLDIESLTEQFTVLSEDYARVDPEIWQRAGRAMNQRERVRERLRQGLASYE